MDITTETTTVVTITLTEDEARTALVDPEKLQAQLRAALAPLGRERAIRTGRQKRYPVIVPKGKAPGGRKRTHPIAESICPQCGKSFRGRGWLEKHIRKSHGADAK